MVTSCMLIRMFFFPPSTSLLTRLAKLDVAGSDRDLPLEVEDRDAPEPRERWFSSFLLPLYGLPAFKFFVRTILHAALFRPS